MCFSMKINYYNNVKYVYLSFFLIGFTHRGNQGFQQWFLYPLGELLLLISWQPMMK